MAQVPFYGCYGPVHNYNQQQHQHQQQHRQSIVLAGYEGHSIFKDFFNFNNITIYLRKNRKNMNEKTINELYLIMYIFSKRLIEGAFNASRIRRNKYNENEKLLVFSTIPSSKLAFLSAEKYAHNKFRDSISLHVINEVFTDESIRALASLYTGSKRRDLYDIVRSNGDADTDVRSYDSGGSDANGLNNLKIVSQKSPKLEHVDEVTTSDVLYSWSMTNTAHDLLPKAKLNLFFK